MFWFLTRDLNSEGLSNSTGVLEGVDGGDSSTGALVETFRRGSWEHRENSTVGIAKARYVDTGSCGSSFGGCLEWLGEEVWHWNPGHGGNAGLIRNWTERAAWHWGAGGEGLAGLFPEKVIGDIGVSRNKEYRSFSALFKRGGTCKPRRSCRAMVHATGSSWSLEGPSGCGRDAAVHAFEAHSGFVTELVGYFGLSRVVDGSVFATRLIFPQPTDCGNPSFVSLQVLRRSLQGAAKCRILLVRRVSHRRSVRNHDDLLRAMGSFPCETVVEDGSSTVGRQLRSFRDADLGGVGVVELLVEGGDVNLCYLSMSVKLLLRYVGLMMAGSRPDSPMTASIPLVLSTVRGVLGRVMGLDAG
ncbi:hypothetical protein GUITHDRAFT_121414 [Guillardia theta CCMP2712]|uniref:Uncharacterized protein n=1 Tax=Guillardia theta (strain CCMP2712) TaxID=905079 RepID=L1I978_GUITC|nr:hypothetical protein GUITHDRAFT_121414 [Guillardia theta CCMP2712]EKX32410.1 hypothetical protein GUITHDRAFT_121414 [Guillardia theta CCMP2712]|eukprot:XP_005819390.1 hypothetical protein GUITHDRAFT_121414 [Guillardia theta CCMP2712]